MVFAFTDLITSVFVQLYLYLFLVLIVFDYAVFKVRLFTRLSLKVQQLHFLGDRAEIFDSLFFGFSAFWWR